MTETGSRRDAILRGVHVIDGGLASELEYLGARIDGPLWSAHVLEDEPEKCGRASRLHCRRAPSASPHAATRFRAWAMRRWACRRSAPMRRCCARWSWPARRRGVSRAQGSRGRLARTLRRGAAQWRGVPRQLRLLLCRSGPVSSRAHRGVRAARAGPQAPDLLAFETFPSLEEVRAVGEAMALHRLGRGRSCRRGSAFPAATRSTSPTASEWPIAPHWLRLCRRPWRSA